MVEYGNGIGQVAGQATGGGSHASQSVDVGAQLGRLVTDSVHTISTLPPSVLAAGVVLVIVGLVVLRRAF